jgi:hypothetical protein
MTATLARRTSIAARLTRGGSLALGLLCAGVGSASADDVISGLLARHDALQAELGHNQFGRPIHLDSGETTQGIAGDVYAVLDHPFARVSAALLPGGHWCDILILHINTKYCRASAPRQGEILDVRIGSKHDQPLEKAYRVVFAYRVASRTAEHLRVTLHADEGPLGTRHYRILLDAVPLADGRTFTHLSYSYAYGVLGRLAMRTYLGTIGRDKVGFTVTGARPDGGPQHVDGMRGLVERNTMRYYLAIEAFLDAASSPPSLQLDRRLHAWFAATESFPRQLHEVDEGIYLDMKRRETRRQQGPAP